ncbi:MAG: hypothetical protein ABMA64_23415 [Myxococcota bacterium]
MNGLVPDLDLLRARVGRYAGHGIDDEDRPFHAELELAVEGAGLRLTASSTGIDGTPLARHDATIGARDGQLALWVGLDEHPRRFGGTVAGAVRTVVFGRGEPSDPAHDRVEIALDLWPDGQVSLRIASGPAGTVFRTRFTARLRPA